MDKDAAPKLLNCMMYKVHFFLANVDGRVIDLLQLCYYRFGIMQTEYNKPSGYDRVRNVEIGNKDFDLEYLVCPEPLAPSGLLTVSRDAGRGLHHGTLDRPHLQGPKGRQQNLIPNVQFSSVAHKHFWNTSELGEQNRFLLCRREGGFWEKQAKGC